MPRTVVLEHRLTEDDFHFDWLIDRDGRSPLLTFRLRPVAPEQAAPAGSPSVCPLLSIPPPWSFRAERIGDHRRLYLDYEGPVSGGRGEVRRLARGEAEILTETGESIEIRVRWERAPGGLWKGRRAAESGPGRRGGGSAAPGAEGAGELWIFSL